MCEAVNAAFADNSAPGCIVGVDGAVASVLVRQPDVDDLPDRMPAVTPAGNPTTRRLAKRNAMAWWYHMLLSNTAATLLEAFATAPGLTEIRLAVISRLPGTYRLGIVLTGSWTRDSVERRSWNRPRGCFRDRTSGARLRLQRPDDTIGKSLDRASSVGRVRFAGLGAAGRRRRDRR